MLHFTRRFILFFLSAIFVVSGSKTLDAASCTASTGLYSSPATWSCGHIPQSGDDITIPAGVTVTVDITTTLLSNTNFFVFGTLNFLNAAKIKLDCTSSLWVLPGGQLSGGNGGSKVEYCGDPNAWTGPGPTDGPFTIGSSPLPIELISFDGEQEGKKIVLNWKTATETNNAYFTLEKSTNGLSFEEIGKVDGHGTTTQLNTYEFSDINPVAGTNYYRLKQTDINGQSETFNIIAVEYADNSPGCVLTVYPNPCETNCTVSFSDCPEDNNGTVKIEMIDANGAVVSSQVAEQNANGSFNLAVDRNNNLKPGVYIIRASSSKKAYVQKAVLK